METDHEEERREYIREQMRKAREEWERRRRKWDLENGDR